MEEAREAIMEAIEKGELPVVTVPRKYAALARQGIKPFTTFIGGQVIAGTILREPFLPPGEERAVFKIHVPTKQLDPRPTGLDNHFHGVVILHGPIPPEALEEVGSPDYLKH